MLNTKTAPEKIVFNKKKNQLEINWSDDVTHTVTGSALRRYCACSGCRAKKITGLLLVSESTGIDNLQLMGATGLKITFDDGHERGIYPWPYLYAICENRAAGFFDGDIVSSQLRSA
jgi:DUF971 family protein